MSSWKEIAISGSSPDLKSLYLSGTTTSSMEDNPNYFPTASNLWLNNFSGDNNAWKTNEDNLNDDGSPWISTQRTIGNYGTSETHENFDVSGLSPICLPITLINNSNIDDGEAYVQNSTMLLIEMIQNDTDYTDYFVALAALGSGTYTLTDGTSTAIYEITNVQTFQQDNAKITGENINDTSILDLNLGPATICLPPSFTTGSDMVEPLTPGTGPDHGITPSTASGDQGEGYYNVAQSYGTKYLYAETSDPGEKIYSITSPYIDLTDYSTKKLVFYFHLHGPNSGFFNVKTSTSATAITQDPSKQIKFSNWPGTAGNLPSGNIAANYWSGGSANPASYAYTVGPSEVQESPEAPFNRAEVDLSTFTSGYIWIMYTSGWPGSVGQFLDPDKSDFAIGNLYLDLGGYSQPEQFAFAAETPTLEVKGTNFLNQNNYSVRFVNLPQSDPEVLGALYKDPSNLTGIRSQVRISNGPP
jgi:hypothetical protein